MCVWVCECFISVFLIESVKNGINNKLRTSVEMLGPTWDDQWYIFQNKKKRPISHASIDIHNMIMMIEIKMVRQINNVGETFAKCLKSFNKLTIPIHLNCEQKHEI